MTRWLQAHTLAVGAVYFIASVVASIVIAAYQAEIKQYFREYPRKRLREAALNRAAGRLELLRLLHDNAYELNLWFISQVVDSIWLAFLIWMVSSAVYVEIAMRQLRGSTVSSLSPNISVGFGFGTVFGVGFGVFFGTAINVREVLRQLRDYEGTVRRLEEKVAQRSAVDVARQ
jgi:hypothetical protein